MSLVKLKDPDEIVDWTFDWNDGFLNAASSPPETVTTSSWSIDPSPSPAELAISGTPSKTTTTTRAFFSGGLASKVYKAINRVTTSGGRTADRTLVIRVEDNEQ